MPDDATKSQHFDDEDASLTTPGPEKLVNIITNIHQNPSPQSSLLPYSQVTTSKSHGFSNSHTKEADIWKKTLDAHNEHEKFLEKIGLATTTAMKNDRLLDSVAPPSFDLIFEPRPRSKGNHPQTPVAEEDPSASVEVDTNKLLKDFYAATKTLTFNRLAETAVTPWRRGVNGHVRILNMHRNTAFRTFHLTGGEPPKTPPNIPSAEQLPHPAKATSSGSKKHHKKHKHITFRGTDDMFHLENDAVSYFGQRPTRPNPEYSNVTPKVDTGMGSQLKREAKFTATGVPIPIEHHHPLTIASRLSPKSLTYESYRAKRQQRINEVTNRLYNNMGSIKNIRHMYAPRSHHGQMVGFGGRQYDGSDMEMLRQPSTPITPFPLSSPGGRIGSSPYSARVGGLGMDRNGYRYGQNNTTSSNSPRHYGQQKVVDNSQQQSQNLEPNTSTSAGGKKYRPSQLLPLHIPGPKYDNIYIGPYSEEADGERESIKHPSEIPEVPMKSRKR